MQILKDSIPLNQLIKELKENKPKIEKSQKSFSPFYVAKKVDTSYEPVNKQAAMMIAKSPWYNKPVNERKENEKTVSLQRKVRKPKKTDEGGLSLQTRWHPQSKIIKTDKGAKMKDESLLKGVNILNTGEMINIDELAKQVALALERNAPKELSDLAKCSVDARKVIKESAEGIGELSREFDGIMKSATQYFRTARMTTVSECAMMSKALQEIRQFFLGYEHEKEIKRLQEFVDLCERLKSLKDSGFIDTIADTMIRMA